ncbi:MAG TPA: lipase family protein [Candidatus Acidoferrum sp.]|nr:lipase family protein [Candidatus Acidoferrum sp.]
MSQGVPYSASRQDLFYPAKNLDNFPSRPPKTDAELCAWMSLLAYCDKDPDDDFAFDQAKITQKLAALGFQPLQPMGFFESQGNKKNGGTHCFIAFHDDPVKANQLAVVAFRGTDADDPTDLLDDAEANLVNWNGKGQVFDGFKDALEEVQEELFPAVQALDCRKLFTGHSLGAALATLLATIKAPDALFTIGSPRVGDHDFIASLAGVKSFRYVDCCDIVTQLPPTLFGYAHLGDPYYIDRNRQMSLNPSDDFISGDRLRARADYLLQYAWKSGNVAVRDLADHAPINYVTAVAAAQP